VVGDGRGVIVGAVVSVTVGTVVVVGAAVGGAVISGGSKGVGLLMVAAASGEGGGVIESGSAASGVAARRSSPPATGWDASPLPATLDGCCVWQAATNSNNNQPNMRASRRNVRTIKAFTRELLSATSGPASIRGQSSQAPSS
jgi:hypothetical protein